MDRGSGPPGGLFPVVRPVASLPSHHPRHRPSDQQMFHREVTAERRAAAATDAACVLSERLGLTLVVDTVTARMVSARDPETGQRYVIASDDMPTEWRQLHAETLKQLVYGPPERTPQQQQRNAQELCAFEDAHELGQAMHFAEWQHDFRRGDPDADGAATELRARREIRVLPAQPSGVLQNYTAPRFIRWTTRAPRLRRERRSARRAAPRRRRTYSRDGPARPSAAEPPLARSGRA